MDLRVEKTYRSLIAAFTGLLSQYRYEDISVALLCERALIRRTTFYKHFADKDEFFRFFLLSMRDEFRESTSLAAKATNVREYQGTMSRALMAFVESHAAVVDNIVNSSMSGVLFDALADVMTQDLISVMSSAAIEEGISASEIRLRAAYLASGPVAVLKYWWFSGRNDVEIDVIVSVVERGAQGF